MGSPLFDQSPHLLSSSLVVYYYCGCGEWVYIDAFAVDGGDGGGWVECFLMVIISLCGALMQ